MDWNERSRAYSTSTYTAFIISMETSRGQNRTKNGVDNKISSKKVVIMQELNPAAYTAPGNRTEAAAEPAGHHARG